MARRRGNQEGSIYKREDGSWRAQITLDGRRLSHSGKTRAVCQEWLKKTIKQIDSGLSFEGASLRLDEYMEMWMQTVKENRRQKTHIQYEGLLRRYILPAFGSHRLRDLHPIQIERYLNQLKADGVGERTCQLVFSTLQTALNSAVRKGLIGRNPINAVEKPRVQNVRTRITLEPDQVQRFLIAAQEDRNAVMYHLAVVTGLREGEILGLKWEDVDWGRSRLKVMRQVYRVPKVGMVFTTPKTQSGIRVLTLGTRAMEKLFEHRQRQKVEKAEAGERWQEMDLIFPSVIGTPLDPHNLLKEFKALLAKADLPEMRFHDLRHTSITLVLNEIGAPVKEAQRRAGHASPSTTMNIYGGEATMKLDEVVAQSLDDLVTPIQVKIPLKEAKHQVLRKSK